MALIPVVSSDLAAIDYKDGILYILFRSGGLYSYFYVPKSVADGLLRAPSKGKYFHAYVKNQYSFRKIR